MRKIDTVTEQVICEAYLRGEKVEQISKDNVIHKQTVYEILWRNKVMMRTPYKDLCQKEICQKYIAGDSANVIAKEYKVALASVSRILKLNEISIRTYAEQNRYNYPLKEDVFDDITSESAYWVGFLMADGCIVSNKSGLPGICLALSEIDVDHVENFRRFLGAKNNKITKHKGICSFHITSSYLANKLAEYGVVPRKSFTAKVAKCFEFNRDFWRGMIDGDGWISNKRKLTVGLCGSWDCCNQFKKYVYGILPKCSVNVIKAKSIWQFTIIGKQVVPVVEALYQNAELFLPRKERIARQIIDNFGSVTIISVL